MEKQRINRKKYIFSRLLISLFAITFVMQSEKVFSQQRLTYKMIQNLTVMPVNQTNFSSTDCAFELKIPYVKSDSVQAQIPELPNGVNFVSLRRSEYSDENKESGTKIELWLNFADAKTYRLRSLKVYINSRLHYIQFEPVVILENPRNIMPRLVVAFENGQELISERRGNVADEAKFTATAGVPLNFTVYLQYGVQIISYEWTVPKNALVKETARYEITKGTLRSSEFSEEKVPVATFEWEPLYPGKLPLHDLKIIATSYNGTRVTLNLPETLIPVQEGFVKKNNLQTADEAYFGYAFTKNSVKKSPLVHEANITSEDCVKLAQLRTEERHSFPFFKKYNERKTFEIQHGVTDGSTEPTYFMLWSFLTVFAIFVILAVVSLILHKISHAIFFTVIMLFFFAGTIISTVLILRSYAIFSGGSISSVPEESVSAISSIKIETGKRVLVEQKAGNWVFIRYGSSGGWVNAERIIFIDKK